MNFAILHSLIFICFTGTPPVKPILNGSDGLAYIEVAEDILSTGNSDSAVEFARKCFVLSVLFDPSLKRSAMLGLIDIEDDENRSAQLISSLPSGKLLIGEVVVHVDAVRPAASPEAIIAACKEVQNLRTSDKVDIVERDEKQTELLRFASLAFTTALRQVLLHGGRVPRNQRNASDSLKGELALLGGTTQWSAAILVEGNVPLSVSGTIDLAAIMGVDTSTYIFESGNWREP